MLRKRETGVCLERSRYFAQRPGLIRIQALLLGQMRGEKLHRNNVRNRREDLFEIHGNRDRALYVAERFRVAQIGDDKRFSANLIEFLQHLPHAGPCDPGRRSPSRFPIGQVKVHRYNYAFDSVFVHYDQFSNSQYIGIAGSLYRANCGQAETHGAQCYNSQLLTANQL